MPCTASWFGPPVLVDASARDASVPFFDGRLPMPFIVGPTGLNGAARPGGDAMLALRGGEGRHTLRAVDGGRRAPSRRSPRPADGRVVVPSSM